jgi:hypothetical protein
MMSRSIPSRGTSCSSAVNPKKWICIRGMAAVRH